MRVILQERAELLRIGEHNLSAVRQNKRPNHELNVKILVQRSNF